MNNLIIRALTGAIFASVVIGSIFVHHLAATGVFSLFMILGIIEFYKLFKNHEQVEIDWRLGTTFVTVIYGVLLCSLYGFIDYQGNAILFPMLFILVLTELWRKKKNPIINASVLFFGAFYIGLPFYWLTTLNLADMGQNWFLPEHIPVEPEPLFSKMPVVVMLILLVWTNDTFAYLSGRLFGRTKLFERISPNKTWEGTIGGIAFTLLLGGIFGFYTNNGEQFYFWVFGAALIAPCAILGDLFQSMMKRSLNIKDSGNILPGHGGILDRFDALLFTVPFFMAWTWIYTYL